MPKRAPATAALRHRRFAPDPLTLCRPLALALGLGALLGMSGLLGGCAGTPQAAASAQKADDADDTPATGRVLGRNDRLLVYQSRTDESLAEVARRFLGSPDLAWMISDLNKGAAKAEAGKPLVVPLKPLNPAGIQADRYQTVPILCYHRFGPATTGRSSGTIKMTMSATDFGAQLDWLARNDFHVLKLADIDGWLQGRKPLPARSVILTADDGYASFYKHAFPLLKKHGFHATLFVYTDFIGAGDAVDWAEMKEMVDSGLVDVQAHSRTHRNLIDRVAGESDERYLQILENETKVPRELLGKRLGTPQRHYAYPYGDANQAVLDALNKQGVDLGVTVTPGGNAFFAQPLMLRRTMIYGDMTLEDFKARLQTSRPIGAVPTPR